MKNQPFYYYSKQWGADVALFVGDRDEFSLYLKRRWKFKGDNKQDHNLAALSFRLHASADDHVVAYVMWMPEFSFLTREYSTLAHETLHLAAHILDDRKVKYDDDAKEALTYTFDDLYGNFLKKLHLQYKKGECKS